MNLKDATLDELMSLAYRAAVEYDLKQGFRNEDSLKDVDYDYPEYGQILELLSWSENKNGVDIDDITFKMVEDHGGEGQGDEAWFVLEFTQGDLTRYVRRTGYYASWDGFYWDDGSTEEVEARPVTHNEWFAL